MLVFSEAPQAFARAFCIYFSSKTMKHPLKVAFFKIGPKLLRTSAIRGDFITWNLAKIVISMCISKILTFNNFPDKFA